MTYFARHIIPWIVVACSLVCASAQEIDLGFLRSLEGKVKSSSEKANPAVVAIASQNGAAGTAVIVNKDGLMLTAGHVTEAAGKTFTVIFMDGREVKAKALGANMNVDAGMAQIVEDGEWPFVEMGDSDLLKLGDWCFAMGHTSGFDVHRYPPVRIGRLWRREKNDFLLTDCSLSGGDSGGPLLDLDGKVIGIHSSVGLSLGENRHIPITMFKRYWDRMALGENWGDLKRVTQPDEDEMNVRSQRAVLGVKLDRNGFGDGIRVEEVISTSPAEKAGFEEGDRIVGFNDNDVANYDEFKKWIQQYDPGDEIEIQIHRGEEEITLEVTLEARENVK